MSHTRTRGRRRLAVLAMAPLLALSATSATAQGVWVTAPPMPTARAGVTGAAADCPEGFHGTCVYAVGGGATFDLLEAYSPAVGTWATLPRMKTPRYGQASTTAPCPDGVRGDCVYALGGTTGVNTALATAEAYSTETNAWLTVRSMPTARSYPAAATAPCPEGLGLRGTCVYVFGGADAADTALATVEAYSPATNTWATLTPLKTARTTHAGTAAPCPGDLGLKGTCVYAVGGRNTAGTDIASVEVYSPLLNAWQYVPDMPTPRGDQPGAAHAPCPEGMSDGCVYVLGGINGGTTLATAEAYSPVANAWVTLPSMPTPRREHGVAAAPCPKNTESDCVYAYGGVDAVGPTAVTEAFAIERGEGDAGPKPKPKPSAQPTPPEDDPFGDEPLAAPKASPAPTS